MKKKTLVIGGGGREASIAWRLGQTEIVNAVAPHANPTLISIAEKTGGNFLLEDHCDGDAIASFAVACDVDIAFVSNDSALASGVVDSLLAAGIRTVGPTRASAEIEWNKSFGRRLIAEYLPEFSPKYWIIKTASALESAIAEASKKAINLVVKPQGLTGGRGVKVMGDHLADYAAVRDYALEILSEKIGQSEEVVLEEKLEGIEFTIQALTDGKTVVQVPASYDFPFRFDGDAGPGTGGMGAITGPGKVPSFIRPEEYLACIDAISRTLNALSQKNFDFNGVLNTGFFATEKGIRIFEFNARYGDPECMNMMLLLETPLIEVLEHISNQRLDELNVSFSDKASVVKYLVPPEYCIAPFVQREFEVNLETISESGAHVFFGAAAAEEIYFKNIGASRTMAIGATASTLSEANKIVEDAILHSVSGDLMSRSDIGSEAYVQKLLEKRMAHAL